jgi:preprotein translocase subunit SecE
MAAARGGNQLRSMMEDGQTRRRGRLQFFGEIYSELTRVTWPDRQDAARLAGLVIIVAAVMGVFLGLWDFAFQQIVEGLFL